MNRIILGDNRESLKKLIAEGIKIQTCITSPPYFGLRDYGTGRWEGGDPNCDHKKNPPAYDPETTAKSTISPHANTGHAQEGYKGTCGKCGAIRIDKQIGMESTPEEYVASLVEVFSLVWQIMADDGTLWLNLGDSYYNYRGASDRQVAQTITSHEGHVIGETTGNRNFKSSKLKCKDIIGIPWMTAFALRDFGWYLRSPIVWAKPNCIPESVEDRPTKSYEMFFLLTKNANYYYNADAIKEPYTDSTIARIGQDLTKQKGTTRTNGGSREDRPLKALGHNREELDDDVVWRTECEEDNGVWEDLSKDKRPPGIVRDRMYDYDSKVKAMTNREVSTPEEVKKYVSGESDNLSGHSGYFTKDGKLIGTGMKNKRDVWWISPQPYKGAHYATFPTALVEPPILAGSKEGDIVLDPFGGSGTVAQVAMEHGRNFILLELNKDYLKQMAERLGEDQNGFFPSSFTVEEI
jgi:DNA modification methylase